MAGLPDRYSIGPHTDSYGKWVTVLYYLPKTYDAPRTAGTCVMRSKSGMQQGQVRNPRGGARVSIRPVVRMLGAVGGMLRREGRGRRRLCCTIANKRLPHRQQDRMASAKMWFSVSKSQQC